MWILTSNELKTILNSASLTVTPDEHWLPTRKRVYVHRWHIQRPVRRLLYEYQQKAEVRDLHVVRPACGNSECVNPDHQRVYRNGAWAKHVPRNQHLKTNAKCKLCGASYLAPKNEALKPPPHLGAKWWGYCELHQRHRTYRHTVYDTNTTKETDDA